MLKMIRLSICRNHKLVINYKIIFKYFLSIITLRQDPHVQPAIRFCFGLVCGEGGTKVQWEGKLSSCKVIVYLYLDQGHAAQV